MDMPFLSGRACPFFVGFWGAGLWGRCGVQLGVWGSVAVGHAHSSRRVPGMSFQTDGHAHSSDSGMGCPSNADGHAHSSRPGVDICGLCPLTAASNGHVRRVDQMGQPAPLTRKFSCASMPTGMLIFRALEWTYAGYAHRLARTVGMSGAGPQRWACPSSGPGTRNQELGTSPRHTATRGHCAALSRGMGGQ